MTQPIDLDEAEFAGQSATPADWIFCGNYIDDSRGLPLLRLMKDFEEMNCSDLHFIIFARNNWSSILSELRELRAEVAMWRLNNEKRDTR